ncbi:hypothetical protein C8R44DRAFT_738200 [Mycena epipterygia]|nr:hypothetical protein C8R44DRAFT_738200 [Mycena epipterygia]
MPPLMLILWFPELLALLILNKVGDHGDGFYAIETPTNGTTVYKYHGNGDGNNSTKGANRIPADGRRLNPVEHVICKAGGEVLLTDVTAAQSGFNAQLGAGLQLKHNQNAFYTSRSAVAFACCYASSECQPTANQFNSDMGAVSQACGSWTSLGYVRDPRTDERTPPNTTARKWFNRSEKSC